jgi:hypothetical protein
MTLFLVTFLIIAVVIALMAIGVMFGRGAIKGSCGGVNNGGECLCTQKCEKRRKPEAMAQNL